jgi:hypothetical protein
MTFESVLTPTRGPDILGFRVTQFDDRDQEMNDKAAQTIDEYIPAAHLMVITHAKTKTMNEAVNLAKKERPDFDDACLRLLWLGINAKSNATP